MFHTEGVLILLNSPETGDKRIGKTIGDLEADTEEHREDEENGHGALLEEGESLESKSLDQTCAFLILVDVARRQGESIEEEHDAEQSRGEELVLIGLEAHQVDQPHGADEADGAEDTDGWEVLHRVHPRLGECRECHRVGQGDGRHKERHAQRIEEEQRAKLCARASCIAIITSSAHKYGGNEVAETKEPLCRYPPIGDDTHNGGHENGDNALNGIKPTYLRGQTDIDKIGTHGCQVGTPYCELKVVHQC